MDENAITNFKNTFFNIENEIAKAIIGQKDIIKNVLICIIAEGNVLLEGLPGLGKTQLVKTIGQVLDLEFKRIQFTPDLMPQDITGTNILIKDAHLNNVFQFEQGPLFSNIVLADEINRATPKTQSALLEAMQERTVTVGKKSYILPQPFFVLATQNPIEMEGTYPLPEAQMDRFMFKLDVQFPSTDELIDIVKLTSAPVRVDKTADSENSTVNKVISGKEIIEMGRIAHEVPLSKTVMEYAIQLITSSHPKDSFDFIEKYVRYGSSPRGAQSLIAAARIYALLDSRFNVSYEDINLAAFPVLRHRIFLNFEALAEGITPDDVIQKLIEENRKTSK